jgi:hypothetical protein
MATVTPVVNKITFSVVNNGGHEERCLSWRAQATTAAATPTGDHATARITIIVTTGLIIVTAYVVVMMEVEAVAPCAIRMAALRHLIINAAPSER